MFDSGQQNYSLRELLFFADNLAAFPYQMQDEVFFIIHTVDIQLSITGAHILSEFKNLFYPERKRFMGANDQHQQQLEFAMAPPPHISSSNHSSMNNFEQQHQQPQTMNMNATPSMMSNNVNSTNSLYPMSHQVHHGPQQQHLHAHQQHSSGGMISNGVCEMYPQQNDQG